MNPASRAQARVMRLGAVVLIVVAVMVMILAIRAKVPTCKWTRPDDLSQFATDGQKVIDVLEQYRAANGQYPDSLPQAGVSEQSPFGPWRYRVSDQRSMFWLAIGDYSVCLWESTYSSKDASWYHDG